MKTFVYESRSIPCFAPSDIGVNATVLADQGWETIQVIPPVAVANPIAPPGMSLFQQGSYTFLVRRKITVSRVIDYVGAEEVVVQ